MYLKKLELRNSGPIKHAKIECKFNSDEDPKPIIFVGENGSGKSIALAHVANAILVAHSQQFEDSDIEKDSVYKLRSTEYVLYNSDYSTGEVLFSNNFEVSEIQLTKPKNKFKNPPDYPYWRSIKNNEYSHIYSNFYNLKPAEIESINHETHIYFPPNRFEEPAWLNEQNLNNKARFPDLKNTLYNSNRPVVNYAPMRELQDWILDIILEAYALEQSRGPIRNVSISILEFISTLFGVDGKIGWFVGSRNKRRIGLACNSEVIINNMFGLSTGQTVLFDLFLTIIRDFDLSESHFSSLSNIKGIVIVDEIDLHLHSDLQHDLLPKLIQHFPKVQFIMSTHSPLFLLGMEKTFPDNGIQIIEFPIGQEIKAERFSEFKAAYEYMKNTACFDEDIQKKLESSQKPVLFLEGTTDKDYLEKAAKLLDKIELLEKYNLEPMAGSADLDKIWAACKSSNLNEAIKKNWLLLYDCDVELEEPLMNGKLFRRKIQKQNHKINKGIENLFPDETIKNACFSNRFVNEIRIKELGDGDEEVSVEKWEIKNQQKRNLCNWLCKNGQKKDFESFSAVFDILEEVLNS